MLRSLTPSVNYYVYIVMLTLFIFCDARHLQSQDVQSTEVTFVRHPTPSSIVLRAVAYQKSGDDAINAAIEKSFFTLMYSGISKSTSDS